MANSCIGTTTKDPITDENIFHLMNNQPISWKVYAQNYLNAGGTVNVPDFTAANQPKFTNYYARHNAAIWYEEILSNTLGSQGNIVDFEQFGIDVANGTLPRFAIIAPDGCWDLHDGCFSLSTVDSFLNSSLTPMLNLADFKTGGSGLLIVTFDNGNADGAGKVFVNDEAGNEIGVIDVKARKTIGRYKLAGCMAPTGLAYIPDGKLLISTCENEMTKVLQADTGKEIARRTTHSC